MAKQSAFFFFFYGFVFCPRAVTTRGEVPLLWNQARALRQIFTWRMNEGRSQMKVLFFCFFSPDSFIALMLRKQRLHHAVSEETDVAKRSGRLRLCHGFDLDIPHNARGSDQIQKWQTIWGETSQDILVATWKVSVSSKLETKHFAILFICAFFINTENFAKDNFFIYQTPGMIYTALEAKSCLTMGTILPHPCCLQLKCGLTCQSWVRLRR